MSATISGRLVVTGHDERGAAIVLRDGVLAATELAGPAVTAHLFGGRDDIACFPERVVPVAGEGQSPPGGWRCASLTIAPGADSAYHRFVADALGSLADPDQPGFHKTPTTDLIFVVSGMLRLELDAGEVRTLGAGDVAILNGVRHRWSNPGDEAATLVCTQVGAHHEAPAPVAPSPSYMPS